MVSCRNVSPWHARASIGLYKDAAGGSTVLDEEDCMRRFVFTALLAALWSPALPAAPVASKTRPIRVLILDGQSAGPYHDWRLTTAVVQKGLANSGLFPGPGATTPRARHGLRG